MLTLALLTLLLPIKIAAISGMPFCRIFSSYKSALYSHSYRTTPAVAYVVRTQPYGNVCVHYSCWSWQKAAHLRSSSADCVVHDQWPCGLHTNRLALKVLEIACISSWHKCWGPDWYLAGVQWKEYINLDLDEIGLRYEEPLSDSVIIQVQNDADGLANSRSSFAAGNVLLHLLHLAPSPAHALQTKLICWYALAMPSALHAHSALMPAARLLSC